MTTQVAEKSVGERPPARKRNLRKFGQTWGPIAAALPAVLIVGVFLAYPIGYGFWMSLHEVSMFNLSAQDFVGFTNYQELFADPAFRNSLWRTMIFVFGVIIIGMAQSLAFGLTLHYLPNGRFVRALNLVPYFISSVAVAMVWRFFVQSDGGFTSFITEAFGQTAISWLADGNLALFVVTMATVWMMAPFSVLLILSGLQTVNADMYEAAQVDGANAFQRFIHVTLPSIRPQIATSLIWLTFQAFNSFGLILALTGGGPGDSTELLAVYMYALGMENLDISGSSAVMIIILVLNAVFSLIYLKLFPTDEPEKS
ncbi:carbohydrate ABC transporter permease [Nesterenkonia sp. Act20]|uniref:carbohydrate ABC transporter permease n=1 Tax=Nesterenkonia sp. Act20 TaxID=1483432 RepID=UPI001C4946A7|nr:sugar ABC transporter permease [Nesterenkonia sp. Act20]